MKGAAVKRSVLTIDQIRFAVEKAAESFDVARAYLFGSYAKGRATEASDVDICLETGRGFSLFSAGGLASTLEKELDVPVDLVTEGALYPFVRDDMLKDRVLIYERV